MAAAGKSRFSVTCALLRRYMREHQGQMGDLAGLFQAPAPPVAPEENDDDRIMQLFPMRAVAMPAQVRPEMKKEAPMAILYEVPHQLDEAQMRAASLHRFLGKRKVRISDNYPDHIDDSTPAKKKQKDAAARKPFQDVPDPSWLRL